MSAVATRQAGTQADWRCVSLGDICSKPQYGWTTKAKPESGELKLLRTTDITSGQIDWPRVPFCTELPPDPERYLVREGDILISRAGSVGVSHLVTSAEPSVFASYLIRFRPGPDVLPKYLAYFLKSPAYWKQIADNTAGIAIPNVNASKLQELRIPLAPLEEQRRIVAELEKQFSRLDEAVANLKRVKANAQHFERATIETLTSPGSFSAKVVGTVADVAVSLDNMREPVNKTERAKRVGTIPYLGANGQTGWIDEARFDEELVLVVEDETFVGRKLPFSYYFSGKCWVNNHTHVLRARRDAVLPKYLNLALSYYPFIPLTTGSTGRRKLTKAALMSAPIVLPDLATQQRIVTEVDRRLSIGREVEAEVDANLKRAQALRQAILATVFFVAL